MICRVLLVGKMEWSVEHLADIYGDGRDIPQDVIDALNGAAPCADLGYDSETYKSLYAGLRGWAPLLAFPAKNP